MRQIIFPIVAVLTALFAAGCAGPEQKLGRGLSNTYEIVRMGELRKSVEENAILQVPGSGCYGLIHGFDRTIARTGIGLIEVVTFPVPTPTYKPLFPTFYDAGTIPGEQVFPESYKPGLYSDALFDTDTYTGFSGGDIAPYIPGSRFKVFDN